MTAQEERAQPPASSRRGHGEQTLIVPETVGLDILLGRAWCDLAGRCHSPPRLQDGSLDVQVGGAAPSPSPSLSLGQLSVAASGTRGPVVHHGPGDRHDGFWERLLDGPVPLAMGPGMVYDRGGSIRLRELRT